MAGIPDSITDSLTSEPPSPERRRRRLVANRAFGAIKAQHSAERTPLEHLADKLNGVASSTPFLAGHALWFAIWISWNTGLLGFEPFDPFPFGLLTMIVSLEAIFLSTFVLITQNRMAAAAEKRAELDLQISLLAEHEVTKLVAMVEAVTKHLGIQHEAGGEVEELKRNVAPEAVLDAIDSSEKSAQRGS